MAEAAGGHWMYVPEAIIHHEVPAHRASFRFFLARCFAEGYGKALMAHQLGSNAVTLMERAYTRRVAGVAARRPALVAVVSPRSGHRDGTRPAQCRCGLFRRARPTALAQVCALLRRAGRGGTALAAADARLGGTEPHDVTVGVEPDDPSAVAVADNALELPDHQSLVWHCLLPAAKADWRKFCHKLGSKAFITLLQAEPLFGQRPAEFKWIPARLR